MANMTYGASNTAMQEWNQLAQRFYSKPYANLDIHSKAIVYRVWQWSKMNRKDVALWVVTKAALTALAFATGSGRAYLFASYLRHNLIGYASILKMSDNETVRDIAELFDRVINNPLADFLCIGTFSNKSSHKS